MAWVVDTSVVLDLITPNVAQRQASAACLWKFSGAGLLVCPVTYAELGPAFGGDPTIADQFLSSLSIEPREPWTEADTLAAHRLWNDHQQRRRAAQTPKRPIADVLIAAFASRFEGIITRNAGDFRRINSALVVMEP